MLEDYGNLKYFLVPALIVGTIKLTILGLSTVSLIADFLLPATNYTKYGSKKGTWALVTGSSDGLGLEFSKQLAAKGFNIVLASRTESKLQALASEITEMFGVETKIIAVDVTKPGADEEIFTNVKSLPVSVLVNNVGRSHSIPVPFVETESEELESIITINTTFTLKLTRLVVPIIDATATKFKVKGLILTMGSFGGLLPTPYLAVYSGSKAFLQNWSASLAAELPNIDVEFVLSYLVTSSMSKIKRTSFMIPNPKNFVRATLSKVGRRNGAQERFATTTPYWSHALMHFAIDQTVGVYSKIANGMNYSMHKDIRRRALRKAERQKKAL